MVRKLMLPDGLPEVHPDGRRFAASAQRNADAILAFLESHAPKAGRALEIASGTGQHICHFASALPGLDWHPSEADHEGFASIEAWRRHANRTNVHAPLHLDATALPWPADVGRFELVLLVNLLHLISDDEADRVLSGVASALNPGGRFILYGPFRRAGRLTSEGDANFHAQLQAQDSDIGYKDDVWIRTRAAEYGLGVWQVAKMPANNLAFIFRTAH
jgi:SAM-dependent methyltransferase